MLCHTFACLHKLFAFWTFSVIFSLISFSWCTFVLLNCLVPACLYGGPPPVTAFFYFFVRRMYPVGTVVCHFFIRQAIISSPRAFAFPLTPKPLFLVSSSTLFFDSLIDRSTSFFRRWSLSTEPIRTAILLIIDFCTCTSRMYNSYTNYRQFNKIVFN